MKNKHPGRFRFSLSRAILFSLLVHVLFFVISDLMPERGTLETQAEDEVRVEFLLDQDEPAEAEAETARVPDPVPMDNSALFDATEAPEVEPAEPQNSPEPSRIERLEVSEIPEEAGPLADTARLADRPAPESLEMPLEAPTEAVDDPAEDPVAEPRSENPEEELDGEPVDDPAEETTEPGIELPGEAADSYRDSPNAERLSVGRAVREIQRSLAEGGKLVKPAEEEEPQEGNPKGIDLPDLENLPRFGFGDADFRHESGDYDWTDYDRQIYVAIWRAWHNRLYATTDDFERWGYGNDTKLLQHQSVVRFTIESSGQVTGIVVEGPAGCYPLDASAADALQEVVLPPLPADYPRDRETIHGTFRANGAIHQMRRSLAYGKAMGYF